MKKRVIYPAEIRNSRFISYSEMATVTTLQDGSILKIFNPNMLNFMKGVGIDTERKILDAKSIKGSPEVLIPTAAAYFPNGKFMGIQ